MRMRVWVGVVAVVGMVLAAGVAWFAMRDGMRAAVSNAGRAVHDERAPSATGRTADVAAPGERARPEVPPAAEAGGAAGDEGSGEIAPDELVQVDDDALAAAWATVDLDEVRRAMPDNLYWQYGVPTTDEQVVERRAQERRRWNDEYGKVLSGTGTEEEIRAYYDHRAQLSGDYVEFTTYLLDHYGETLPERDVAFLQLARRLHLSRLEEIPRQIEESLAHKRKQDEVRAQWLADEAAFRAGADRPDAE